MGTTETFQTPLKTCENISPKLLPLQIMKDSPPVNILIFICIDSPDIFNQIRTFPNLPSNSLLFLFRKSLFRLSDLR